MTENLERGPAVPPARQSGPGSPASAALSGKKGGGKNKKVANGLVALGSAAIISVYGLGYARTQSAEASVNGGSPTIAVATAAPTATTAAIAAQAPAFQSPLFAPTATAAAPSATATGVAPTATTTAPAATTAPTTAPKAPATTSAAYKDGTYTGTGTSRHGSITASVVIQGGTIASAEITQCGTRYPCAKIATLPGQVVARQSAAVDLVSGATDSSQAYQGAIKNALAKAAA